MAKILCACSAYNSSNSEYTTVYNEALSCKTLYVLTELCYRLSTSVCLYNYVGVGSAYTIVLERAYTVIIQV